jgi:ribosomal protein S18 acetylase RimI-like enzyme
MEKLDLRDCREEDRAFLWEVRRQALRDHVAAMWGWDEPAQREKFDRRFTPAGHQIIVHDGRDAGVLNVVDEGSHLVVGKIELLPAFQRRGIGSALMNDILARARSRNVPVHLQVLLANTPARRFYERLGFEVVARTESHFQMLAR